MKIKLEDMEFVVKEIRRPHSWYYYDGWYYSFNTHHPKQEMWRLNNKIKGVFIKDPVEVEANRGGALTKLALPKKILDKISDVPTREKVAREYEKHFKRKFRVEVDPIVKALYYHYQTKLNNI